MKKLLIPAALLLGHGVAPATILAFSGGETTSGTFAGDPGNLVLDAGFLVPATNTTDPVLFETGGDGIGTVLALVGSSLEVYHDQNGGPEPSLSLDISALAGQVISIRLNADFSLANGSRTLGLAVETLNDPGSATFLNTITTNDDRLSGGDGTGFGGITGSLAGNGEAASPVTGFDVPARDLAGPGSSVLGADVLVGTLYSGDDAISQRSVSIPSADSYTTLIPEPSSSLLLVLAGVGFASRRRR